MEMLDKSTARVMLGHPTSPHFLRKHTASLAHHHASLHQKQQQLLFNRATTTFLIATCSATHTMAEPFLDQVVLVTGAASGIGYDSPRIYAQDKRELMTDSFADAQQPSNSRPSARPLRCATSMRPRSGP
jgi:hypothetical protein